MKAELQCSIGARPKGTTSPVSIGERLLLVPNSLSETISKNGKKSAEMVLCHRGIQAVHRDHPPPGKNRQGGLVNRPGLLVLSRAL